MENISSVEFMVQMESLEVDYSAVASFWEGSGTGQYQNPF